MKTVLFAALTLVAIGLQPAREAFASHNPPPPPPPVTWSQIDGHFLNWSQAGQWVAGSTEDGYTNWRLPTRAEYQVGIQNGSLPLLSPGTAFYYWTSEKQGNRAWVVTLVVDANGVVDPTQSGGTSLEILTSHLDAIAVRP